jgi:hypothetical protein
VLGKKAAKDMKGKCTDGGTSAPMAGMGAPPGGVYGAIGAPSGGFVASMDSSLPPLSHGANEDEEKDGDDFENLDE